MFHAILKGLQMTDVYDFCGACTDGTTVKVSIYAYEGDEFITTVVLDDAKVGAKLLSAVCGYAFIDSIFVSCGVLCCKAHVHAYDL